MTIMVNNCVDCRSVGLPCQGSSCENHTPQKVLVCDECEDAADRIFRFAGKELCKECISDLLDKELEECITEEDLAEIY